MSLVIHNFDLNSNDFLMLNDKIKIQYIHLLFVEFSRFVSIGVHESIKRKKPARKSGTKVISNFYYHLFYSIQLSSCELTNTLFQLINDCFASK